MSSNQQPEAAEQLSGPAPAAIAAGGPNGTPATAAAAAAAGDALVANANANTTNATTPPIPESRLPTRKDASLKQFLGKMDDYAPIVSLIFPARSHSRFRAADC